MVPQCFHHLNIDLITHPNLVKVSLVAFILVNLILYFKIYLMEPEKIIIN